jgi:hypothetical protein
MGIAGHNACGVKRKAKLRTPGVLNLALNIGCCGCEAKGRLALCHEQARRDVTNSAVLTLLLRSLACLLIEDQNDGFKLSA